MRFRSAAEFTHAWLSSNIPSEVACRRAAYPASAIAEQELAGGRRPPQRRALRKRQTRAASSLLHGKLPASRTQVSDTSCAALRECHRQYRGRSLPCVAPATRTDHRKQIALPASLR